MQSDLSMQIKDILSLSHTVFHANVTSKKKVIELIANVTVEDHPDLSSKDILNALLARERLGATGIGHGVALPHCRLPHIDTPIGVFLLLETPIDYESIDKQPVDLIFALFVPLKADKTHLQILSVIASQLGQASFRDKCRQAKSQEDLFQQAVA